MHLTNSFQRELSAILSYWSTHTLDEEYGGFQGKIDSDNRVVPHAPKGSVLNARILWTFSAAYNATHHADYLPLATRAFNYIVQYLIDPEHGGVYWTVDYRGQPLDTKKQIYALAFALYGVSEYYLASDDAQALALVQELFRTIEQHSYDAEHGGYLEALARDWTPLNDLRLSAKDANEKKTTNTHLHVLEAYANLYRAWPEALLKQRIVELLGLFADNIIDPTTHHMHLFFNEQWVARPDVVSYGHDIEAAWLLLDAAELIGEEILVVRFQQLAVALARAAAEGLAADGGLNYEYDPAQQHMVAEKHWWVQAEAMVGFLNAFELTNEEQFYDYFLSVWKFTQQHLIDHEHGEWRWGINADHTVMPGQDKAGLWKCPYHNSRACLEILKRLANMLSSTPK
ncbi:N-acyl-D-glucosamine 2-epimerase (plasmid) [Hymenobacter sp. NBH84]|uniref:AGE family epimerase/isomerase n=1 Tax=Hymenobacter sp. NBH84 TaxID=2596915 RepID=UPI0016235812|nr:AGE family epimerase/isomerase [Hymenobacter sp. NBH84]QNE42413.1 N-acyl-D-glucosamine 2-epimerase [Hymenobacter sp. NBH84]